MPDAPKTTSQDTLLPVEQRARELLVRDILVLAENATPGAWEVDEDGRPDMDWNRHIYAGEEQRICFMANSGGRNVERDYANAHLITVLVNAVPLITAALTEQTLVTPSLLSDSREAIADAVAEALASVSVAYTHVTLNDMTTAGRSWKVHEAVPGENPFVRNEWLGEFDNKPEANAFAAKLRRERAVNAAGALLSLPQTGVETCLKIAEYHRQLGIDNCQANYKPAHFEGYRDAASRIVGAIKAHAACDAALTPKVIDRDIEGETIERCAKVAEAHRDRFGLDSAGSWDRGNAEAGDEIASSIRALASPSLHGEGK